MRRHWILAITALVLPSLLGLTVLLGAQESAGSPARTRAAIVNEDEIATLPDGTPLPGGRQIIAALTSQDEGDKLDWSVVTAETAAQGLADGTFVATVTVPTDFSASLVEVLTGTSTAVPNLEVRTSRATSEDTGRLAQALARVGAEEFGTTLTIAFLTESLSATGQIADAFAQAANGSQQIADGQLSATSGAAQLATGLDSAAAGTHTLASGTSTLSSGAEQLADGVEQYTLGVEQLHSGLTQVQPGQATSLVGGARQLANGVEQYTGGVAQVHAAITTPQPGQSMSLQQGARELAAGAEQMKALVDQIDPARIQETVAKVQNSQAAFEALADTVSTELMPLQEACAAGDAAACAQATALAETLTASVLTELSAFESDVEHLIQVAQLLPTLVDQASGVDDLVSGTRQLSDGIDALADGIEDNLMGNNAAGLVTGSRSLADGLDAVAAGTGQLAESGPSLREGATSLSSGASQVASGTAELASGTSQMAEGAHTLTDGLDQLASGSASLAHGLSTAADQIPVMSAEEAAGRAQAVATPIEVEAQGASSAVAATWTPTALVLALWASALVWVLAFGAMSNRRIDRAITPAGLALRSFLPLSLVAVAASTLLVVSIALAGIPMAHPVGLWALTCVLGVAVVAVHQGLVAALGQRGAVLASTLALAIQAVAVLGSAPAEAASPILSLIRTTTLLPAARDALAFLLHGSGAGSVGSVVVTASLWALASMILTLAAVAKRRRTTVAELGSRHA